MVKKSVDKGSEFKRKLGISISSTNIPTIQMIEDILKFRFINWEKECVEFEFTSTVAFRWQDLPCSDGLADDIAYEVLRSEWIKELDIPTEVKPSKPTDFHHYQFCINGCGLFEVVSVGLGLSKTSLARSV